MKSQNMNQYFLYLFNKKVRFWVPFLSLLLTFPCYASGRKIPFKRGWDSETHPQASDHRFSPSPLEESLSSQRTAREMTSQISEQIDDEDWQLELILKESIAESRQNLLRVKDINSTISQCSKKFLSSAVETNKLMHSQSWDEPYPIAVYGTLRSGFKNHIKMGSHQNTGYSYFCGAKAFLPHLVAHGLRIATEPNQSAPFEVYFYQSLEDWKNAITQTDLLESFSPTDYARDGRDRGYIRVLGRVRLLPEDYSNYWFEEGHVWEDGRSCNISPSQWGQYEEITAWIYISKKEYLQNIETLAEQSPFFFNK